MSAVSPRLVQRESPDRNLEPALSNLYLSTAADPESDFQTSGIRLTPIEDRGNAWNGSSSPLDHPTNNTSTPGNNEGYGTSYSDFLSPPGDWMSDHTSPVDFVNAWSPPNVALAQDVQTPALNQFNDDPSSSSSDYEPLPTPHTESDQQSKPIFRHNRRWGPPTFSAPSSSRASPDYIASERYSWPSSGSRIGQSNKPNC